MSELVQVTGIRELRDALGTAALELADMRPVNRQAANIVRGAARPAAPRRTGRLASSHRTKITKTQAIITAGSTSVPYAGPIHWGWDRRHIKANPWLSTVAQNTEPEWQAVYQDALQTILDHVGKSTP